MKKLVSSFAFVAVSGAVLITVWAFLIAAAATGESGFGWLLLFLAVGIIGVTLYVINRCIKSGKYTVLGSIGMLMAYIAVHVVGGGLLFWLMLWVTS